MEKGHLFIAGIFIAVLTCSTITTAQSSENLQVQFDGSNFKISVSGNAWFRSGTVGIRAAGQWWASSSKDKYILKMTGQDSSSGKDLIGEFKTTKFTWEAFSDPQTSAKVKVETCVNVYQDIPVVTFDITYLTGLANASMADSNYTLSSFPSFVLEETQVERGYITWASGMAGHVYVDRWSPKDHGVYGSVDGGFPLVVFDSSMQNAVVLSPLNTFMSATQKSFKDDQSGDTLITFGPMSSIDTIPAGYKYSTILVASNNVTGVMRRFGEIMRRVYRKDEDYKKTDFSINYLGYWTDNGGCYHYDITNYANYEEMFLALKKDADSKQLPYRYIQLDSWWYYKGKDNGVKNWTALPDVFPNGIDAVVKSTGWRPVAHNRWWSPECDYKDKFKFIIENETVLPIDPDFWDFLMGSSQSQWSLMVYEQDWLHVQYSKTKALLTQLNLGEVWLKQMGEAAQKYGITIQYCMPWPRHVLQSVAISAVTQTRVSGDYNPNNSQWNVGESALLAYSVGLAPFKDDFRTSSDQPDCRKYHEMSEKYPVLETYVAALTGGPVGPSDQVGTANVTLIMATCMTDGRLLKPTRPALSIDSTYLQQVFGKGGPSGPFWAAFTEVHKFTWYYIMAANLTESYDLSAKELPPSHSTFPMTTFPMSVAYQYTLDGRVTQTADFGDNTSLSVSKCGEEDFQYWAIAPLMDNGWALLGELNKVIPVSETRFTSFASDGSGYSVWVNGVPSEKVTVTLFEKSSKKTSTVDCMVNDMGSAVLKIPSNTCA